MSLVLDLNRNARNLVISLALYTAIGNKWAQFSGSQVNKPRPESLTSPGEGGLMGGGEGANKEKIKKMFKDCNWDYSATHSAH